MDLQFTTEEIAALAALDAREAEINANPHRFVYDRGEEASEGISDALDEVQESRRVIRAAASCRFLAANGVTVHEATAEEAGLGRGVFLEAEVEVVRVEAPYDAQAGAVVTARVVQGPTGGYIYGGDFLVVNADQFEMSWWDDVEPPVVEALYGRFDRPGELFVVRPPAEWVRDCLAQAIIRAAAGSAYPEPGEEFEAEFDGERDVALAIMAEMLIPYWNQ